jgi:hypothetical protein
MPLRTRLIVHAIICSLLLSGCYPLREVRVPPPDEKWQQVPDIQVGEQVVVIRKSGRKTAFKVTSVGTTAIYGKDLNIPYTDIESLQIREFDGRRTAWLGVGIVAGAAALLYAALLVALSQAGE